MAAAVQTSPGKIVRACVDMARRSATMGELERAVSGLDAKVPDAAAPRQSSRAGSAGADSSPAPAVPPAELVQVVMAAMDVRKPFAIRAIRQGKVQVAGVVVRDPMREVVPSEVKV
jgi:hypothetical protein